MKDFFICDCSQHENKVITSSFVVVSKQVKPKKTGEPYLALTLGDRTGQIEAKMWDNVEEAIDVFDQDDFLKVKGLLNKYKNRFQLTIHKVRRLDEADVDFCDYLPKSTKNLDEAVAGAGRFRVDVPESLPESAFCRLLWLMRKSPRLTVLRQPPRLCIMPLSVACWITWSRSFIRAIWSVVIIRRWTATCSSPEPFCMTSARSMNWRTRASFSYTTRGQLLGHMIIELEMLHAKAAQVPEFPEQLVTLLEHLIISHHGHYEFGSPKLPMFPEALMLHYLDDLDSKMESMRAHFEREVDLESPWTTYNPSLGRPLLTEPNSWIRKHPRLQPGNGLRI